VCAAGACVECVAESKRCSSDKQPQTCDSTSKWKDDVPCGGATPVCNSGTCSGIRLHGGIGTLGTYATPAGGVRLRWGGFELAARTCSGNVCVKGGIAP
jgi:hypothetical protein